MPRLPSPGWNTDSAPEGDSPVPPIQHPSTRTMTLRGDTAEDPKSSLGTLNKVTACYRKLVRCVGGTSDCNRLREEMEDSRKKAFHLSNDLRDTLMVPLMEQEVSSEERVQLERIWVLLLSILEHFQQDLCKAQHLCQLFPLHGQRKRLVNTGVTGKTSNVAYRARNLTSPSVRARGSAQQPCSPDLAGQMDHTERMLHDMQMKVSIPIWTVEATEEVWTEVCSTCDLGEGSDNEILAGEDMSSRGCCAHRRLLHWPRCMVS
ncbi:hypothetical protein FKM82_025120 [Ascaphus truei]